MKDNNANGYFNGICFEEKEANQRDGGAILKTEFEHFGWKHSVQWMHKD